MLWVPSVRMRTMPASRKTRKWCDLMDLATGFVGENRFYAP